MTISAAIITLNEAQHITDLVASLHWLDEVVIVDGGSQDDTLALAQATRATVIQRPFTDFAQQRNAALDACQGEWILSIDADERPAPGMAEEVRRTIADTTNTAYHVPIRSTIFGRPFRFCGTQDDQPIRLFRRAAGRWQGSVHETLTVTGNVGRLRHGLTHHTLSDASAFLAKMHRYTWLEAQSRIASGKPPRPWHRYLAPPREVLRRLVWKHGWLDGPEGWAFCLLSGLSEWVLADRHARLWQQHANPRRVA